jgi:ankyrin repeat protein
VRNEHNGATPLHGAAVGGQIAVIEYLLSKGANVNALNAYGDSPVQDAISMKHPETVTVLEARGGKDIRGSTDQRERAIKDAVARDIQHMNQHN